MDVSLFIDDSRPYREEPVEYNEDLVVVSLPNRLVPVDAVESLVVAVLLLDQGVRALGRESLSPNGESGEVAVVLDVLGFKNAGVSATFLSLTGDGRFRT